MLIIIVFCKDVKRGKMGVERLGSWTFALGANKRERERYYGHDSSVLLGGDMLVYRKLTRSNYFTIIY